MTRDAKPAGSLPIWARPEPGARQSRFSRDQIAAAALEIADADGFEAVSMRRIAAKLGAGTMSLYRYITTKADLLALIDDALLGEALVPGELPADWREAITAVARQTRRAYLRHPWAVQALQGKAAAEASLAGPNGLRHFEQSLAALAAAPLATSAKLDLLAIVDDYVFGHILHAAELRERITAAGTSGGTEVSSPKASPDEAATREFIEAQLRTGQFPQLAALASDPAAASVGDLAHLEDRFEVGLRLLVDGFAGRSKNS
jgi:AcrR family transcriptional regulator